MAKAVTTGGPISSAALGPTGAPATTPRSKKTTKKTVRRPVNKIFTEALGDRIVEKVRDGVPFAMACNLNRVSQSTGANWLQWGDADPEGEYGEFACDVREAQAEFVEDSIKSIRETGKGDAKQWTALMTILERTYPEHYRRPDTNINLNVTNTVDGKLQKLHDEGEIDYAGG